MRRHLLCALFGAVAFAAIGVAGAISATPMPAMPAATTKVASGNWNGITWTLFAGETVSANSFSHCISVVLGSDPAQNGGGGCGAGGLRKADELLPSSPPAPGFSYGMNYTGSSHCPTFIVFAG